MERTYNQPPEQNKVLSGIQLALHLCVIFVPGIPCFAVTKNVCLQVQLSSPGNRNFLFRGGLIDLGTYSMHIELPSFPFSDLLMFLNFSKAFLQGRNPSVGKCSTTFHHILVGTLYQGPEMRCTRVQRLGDE